MARNRMGKGTISFTIDSVEYNLDVTSAVLDSEEADETPTFADAGGSWKYYLEVTAFQAVDADALHSLLWATAAGDEAAFVFAPKGATGKRWTGTVVIPSNGATVGGEANTEWTFDKRFELTGRPTVVAATA